jgi:hypothetical protein
MIALYIFTLVLGLLLIADAILFTVKREQIEPNVHARYPNLNCTLIMAGEIVAGLLMIIFSVYSL